MLLSFRVVAGWLSALALAGAAGCGAAEEENAREAATEFVTAVQSQDTGRACGLLAPDTVESLESQSSQQCQQALPSMELPGDQVTEVEVWGDAAQARSSSDVLFLRELADGWRVVAAGCQPQGADQPYECELEGS
jgi:hypothetical protein